MRKPTKLDIPEGPEALALPNTGTIKLSQIKSEFGKGDNLSDYYGVVSGIPSSGTIKVTDFYGKSKPPTGAAPFGNYTTRPPPQSPTYQLTITSSASSLPYNMHLAQVSGTGGGSYAPLPSYIAVESQNSHANYDPPYYVCFPLFNGTDWLDYYQQYQYIVIGSSLGSSTKFVAKDRWGSWTSTEGTWPTVAELGNPDAGQALYNLMGSNSQSIYIGLTN